MKGREIITAADQPADRARGPPRHDAIIFDPRSLYEFGASETGPLFESVNATKWLQDNHKLAKALHDMLSRLQRVVKQDGEVLRSLQMVGIVTSGESVWIYFRPQKKKTNRQNKGLHCQVVRVTYAKGYICLLSREPLREVPTAVDDLQCLLEFLVGIWGAKVSHLYLSPRS